MHQPTPPACHLCGSPQAYAVPRTHATPWLSSVQDALELLTSHPRRMHAGITCTAAGVAVFAIVLVTCMAFWRLRRERRERSRARFDKFADSYPLPGHPLVISDTSSNAYWIQSQSTSADVGAPPLSARLLAEHQASFGTHLAGTTISGPLSQAFLHRALSFDRIPSAPHAPAETDSVQASIGTQVAEYMHVWTPPTSGRPEVTVSTPSGSGRWVPARRGLARASRGRAWSDGGDRTVPRTQDGSLPSTSAWTAFGLTPESPPTQLLEAQLEWLSSHNDGRLLGHLQCAVPPSPPPNPRPSPSPLTTALSGVVALPLAVLVSRGCAWRSRGHARRTNETMFIHREGLQLPDFDAPGARMAGRCPSQTSAGADCVRGAARLVQLVASRLRGADAGVPNRQPRECRLVPYLGLRVGGQGAVAFARHHHAAARVFAMKFFCTEDAFRIEEQAAQLPVRCRPALPSPAPPQPLFLRLCMHWKTCGTAASR